MRLRMLAAAFALLAGCAQQPAETATAFAPPPQSSQPAEEPEQPGGLENDYIQSLVDEALRRMTPEGPADWQRVQAAYRYLISNTTFADPVGLDAWRWRGTQRELPPYLENRALSPLAFGIGSCEDYAAAMTLVLRRMGFEARYQPGLTVSVQREYVDHAWTLVKLDGAWYHLDPQLEGNVMSGSRMNYRFFLKTDDQMLADHLWGEHWIAYGFIGRTPLSRAQIDEIRADYTPPPCTAPFTAPPGEDLPHGPPPNLSELLAGLERERAAYEAKNGPLDPVELNVSPPVFGEQATPASGFSASSVRYGRRFLSGAEAALYDRLGALAQAWRLDAPEPPPGRLDTVQTAKVWALFLADHPEYDWAELASEPGADGFVKTVALKIRPPLTAAQARSRHMETERAADALLARVERGDAFTQVTGIHDAVAGAVRYDAAPGLADADTLYGALVLGRGICDAYSRCFQYLCQRRGLECIYVNGATAWGAAHAWNAVRLPDGWYYVDTTWDRGKDGVIFHDYLLVTAPEMARERIPRAGQYPALPEAGQTEQNYYVRRGYCVKAPETGMEALAGAFLRSLADLELSDDYRSVFLEIKVLSDEEAFGQIRDSFVKQVFETLERINALAKKQGLPLEVKETEQVRFSYNDATRVLTLTPEARRTAAA